MKKALYIVWIALLAALMTACSWEEEVVEGPTPDGLTRSLNVVLDNDGDEDKKEDIYTVRLIVFDRASSGYPLLDVNKKVEVGEANKTATGFEFSLEVKVGNDKMVVAVVNEPTSLSDKLASVETTGDLESIMYDFGNILNANHTAFRVGQHMPMTGVKRGVVVAESNTSQNPARSAMTVERAFARIDIYLKAATGVTAYLFEYSRISVLDTYNKGYLAVGTLADGTRYQTGATAANNFGRLLTVGASDLLDHDLPEGDAPQYATWSPAGNGLIPETRPSVPTCSFYVPERTCTGNPDDKLKIRFEDIYVPDIYKTKTFALAEATPQGGGGSQTLEMIKRNNVYEITATVKANNEVTFDHFIVPWKEVGMGVIIDPQYNLKVSQDYVSLFTDGIAATITAETDYDRDDRGFPAGLYLGTVTFYDRWGNVQGDNNWLQYTLVGNEGEMTVGIEAKVINASTLYEGYYAVIEFKAGNLSKPVKIVNAGSEIRYN